MTQCEVHSGLFHTRFRFSLQEIPGTSPLHCPHRRQSMPARLKGMGMPLIIPAAVFIPATLPY